MLSSVEIAAQLNAVGKRDGRSLWAFSSIRIGPTRELKTGWLVRPARTWLFERSHITMMCDSGVTGPISKP
nr:unnamed protein product [Haemonchus contortus]